MGRRARGFTLIEILVVMAIILTLVGLLAAGLGTAKDKARSKASRALIGRIQTALESYFSEFRDYPPDGYDVEPGSPGWTYVANQGVRLGSAGTALRPMKGTAALMYFLCRPLIKVTQMGDPNIVDARNMVYTPVGPFLTLDATNFSRGRSDDGSTDDLSRFNPNFVWSGGARATQFWDTAPYEYKFVEIIDAYYRPLCYDKVKVNNATYFQPDRFHNASGGTGVAGKGANAHPDQASLRVISDLDGEELACPSNGAHDLATTQGKAEGSRWTIAVDPRFTPNSSLRAADGCCSGAGPATAATHAPRNIGGYDLWSYGRSYTNPRDDITSWGD